MGDKDSYSIVERYKYFIETSDHGENCGYARKCKELFLKYDYDDIKSLLHDALEEIRNIEGDQTWGNGKSNR